MRCEHAVKGIEVEMRYREKSPFHTIAYHSEPSLKTSAFNLNSSKECKEWVLLTFRRKKDGKKDRKDRASLFQKQHSIIQLEW